jgi:hypothetical protein
MLPFLGGRGVVVPVDLWRGRRDGMAASIYRGNGNGQWEGREPWRSIAFLKCCTVEEYLHPLIDHIILHPKHTHFGCVHFAKSR